jgi:tetratricopeptide (TPR) repeat protein
MSSDFQQRRSGEKLESFEAFDSVTEALEHIDSYNPAQNNTDVLWEAEKSLEVALMDQGDPSYRKAQYFQAMVSYLKGESAKAIERFELMSESGAKSILKEELAYNLAAAYAEAGRWDDAIKKFQDVITNTAEKSGQDNYELRLFARAGLAHCYAKQIDDFQEKLKSVREVGESTVAAALYEQQINRNSAQIQTQYASAKHDARKVLDPEVVKEAEQVIREAYKSAPWAGFETVELLPADPPKKRWKISRRSLIIIAAAVLLFIAYIEFRVGWDYVIRWFLS